MNALELADWADDLFSSDGQPKEVAEMLRKQHEAIVKLREACALYDKALLEASPFGAKQSVFESWNKARKALKDTEEIAK